MTPYLRHALEQLAWNGPMLLIYGAGIVVCLRGRARHPELARWFMVAFILFAAVSLLGPFNRAWMGMQVEAQTMSKKRMGITYGITSGVLGILHYAGWGVLIYGVRRAVWGGAASVRV